MNFDLGLKHGSERRRGAETKNEAVWVEDYSPVPGFTPNGQAQVIGRQLLRAGTSVGANYGAVCRARSSAEFVSKLGVVIEEADESLYWLEMLLGSGTVKAYRLGALTAEAGELISIFVAARQTARQSLKKSKFEIQNS